MAYFLLAYDRLTGDLLVDDTYEHRAEALSGRFAQEERFADDQRDVEVVVLHAESREQLLRTHARYFLSLPQLAERLPGQ